jgi:tetratricopeptide (TPR) repeat protein
MPDRFRGSANLSAMGNRWHRGSRTLRRLLGVGWASAVVASMVALAHGQTVASPSELAKTQEELAKGNYRAAEAALEPALRGAGASPKATNLLATIRLRSGDARGAVTAAERGKAAPGTDGRRARLLLGEALLAQGKRSAATPALRSIVEDYNNDTFTAKDAEDLAIAGRAAHWLRYPKDANQLLGESERADPKRVETLLFRAELFLDKYDPGHAEELLTQALKLAPDDPDVLVGMARVKLEQTLDFDAADALVAKALEKNPVHAGAHAVAAGLRLRDMEIAAAENEIAKGLAASPGNLELLSMRATARFLAEDLAGFDVVKRDVLGRNPEYSAFFTIVAEFAEWEHRYDDIVRLMQEATRIDPDDAKAWALLGLTATRSGDEATGVEALRRAFKKDKFNVRVYNTLNLFEKTIAVTYETTTDPVLRIRYPKAEKPILERYVPEHLARAWASMHGRYGFVPKSPVQVELFDSREAFSVRTSGLPNVGIQGVCFGHVVASLSPKGERFNWGNVLWHELGHVFAIELSKSRVPRWFTEGLSEYETMIQRPEWQRTLDPDLYLAFKGGKLPQVASMNRAFTHAKNGHDVTVAYYAASQLMRFTVETFGMGRVVQALRGWGQGMVSDAVIQSAFGVTTDAYDRSFRRWLGERLARYDAQFLMDETPLPLADAETNVATHPKDAAAHARLALAMVGAGKPSDDVQATLGRALALDPRCKEAHLILYRLARAKKDAGAMDRAVDGLTKAGGDGFTLRMARADMAHRHQDFEAERIELERAFAFDPTQAEPLYALAALAKPKDGAADKNVEAEMRIFERIALLEQHDPRPYGRLLDLYVQKGRFDDAVRIGRSALFVDVESGRTHFNLARALAETGQVAEARFEFESAKIAGLPPAEAAIADQALATLR